MEETNKILEEIRNELQKIRELLEPKDVDVKILIGDKPISF